VLGLPINFFMLPAVQGAKAAVANAVKPHIPIDRAMDLLVERGLPVRSEPDAAAQNVNARPEKRKGN